MTLRFSIPPSSFFPSLCSAPTWRRRVSSTLSIPSKDKLLVIMGATGCGKSGLSVQLASLFPSEIINCDKMQVFKGLDITTNKIPLHERRGIPHHLLGHFDGEFSPLDFRIHAANAVSDIASRNKLPILIGGSNSFIHSLLVHHFDPNHDVFNSPSQFISSDLRYNCCFLWVNVKSPVLSEYLSVRVDDMLDLGLFEELAEFYDAEEAESQAGRGIRKAIGVPEFDRYFEKYPPDKKISPENLCNRRLAYEEAVKAIKENTHVLAEKQIWKIMELRRAGWDINILDATEAVKVALNSGPPEKRSEIWEKQVLRPSLEIVKRFLRE